MLPKLDTRRWAFKDMPVIGKPINPTIHPQITKFEEFSLTDQNILKKIKGMIEEIIGPVTLVMFGSRVRGNGVEISDYDIIVYTKDKIELEIQKVVRQIKPGVKIDLFFSNAQVKEDSVKL